MRACALCALCLAPLGAGVNDGQWRDYEKDAARTNFSPLGQINRTNVGQLRKVWTYHAGNASNALKTAMECNPLVVNGVMYVTSPVLEIIALDAATGREIWKYNPFPEKPSYARAWAAGILLLGMLAVAILGLKSLLRRRRPVFTPGYQFCAVLLLLGSFGAAQHYHTQLLARLMRHILPDPMKEEKHLGPNRGLTYWESASSGAGGSSLLDRRILFAGGHRLVALDALTGEPKLDFGHQGIVNLTENLGRDIAGLTFAVTSPGVVYKDLIVIGSMVSEGPEPAAPGYVRAYDIRTGALRWTFHTIPQPGEFGYDTWPPDAWKRVGGTNAWAGMTADESRGLVYIPLGSPSFDHYGGDRTGKNLFSDCLVAVKGDTGQLVWYYQMVHHDLWDYDLASPPAMVSLNRAGKRIDTLVEATKNGFIFVLDPDTGKPVFPVEERTVPASDVPGEHAWSTQPYPLKPPPLSRTEITEDDLTKISPQAHAEALRVYRETAGAKMFLPPSRRGTLVVPGLHGGANWSGISVDPSTSRLVVNTNEIPYYLKITDAKPGAGFRYGFNGYFRFIDSQGYPAIQPPWGKLTEVDLNSGSIVWQVPLGEYPELTARGIPVTGTENAGGSIQTAGGLVFIAATKDARFRAFDVDSGRILWESNLPAAGHATPATYAVKGKQYVVIAAGGGSMAESPSGDEYVAFALPETQAPGIKLQN